MVETWLALIADHRARYPLAGPLDIYKLLYQGILGAEHLLRGGEAAFAERLVTEYTAVGPPVPAELLWEPVRPDGGLGRLHLRPYKARGGDPAALIAAALEAGLKSWGSKSLLQEVWEAWSAHESCPVPEAARKLTIRLAAEGYPAVHHSPEYRGAYQPAYRLVGVEFTTSGAQQHGSFTEM